MLLLLLLLLLLLILQLQLQLGESGSKVTDSLAELLAEGQRFADQLETYRGKVNSIVSEWMLRYCVVIGIKEPPKENAEAEMDDRPPFQLKFNTKGDASHGRQVKSSMGYATGKSCSGIGGGSMGSS